MVHASEFTGIGGFDLAAQWMGWENRFQCEIDPFCLELLNQNFPNTKKHGDIRETNFTIYKRRIDVLSGGFPCQPYSAAGKRRGKADIRHLWPEMLRSAREFQPPYIVGENVRGLTNWNGGLVFNEVQTDLEAEGYEVTPFLLPASGVNAPHERYRIFFVAYSAVFRRNRFIFERERIQRENETRGEVRTGSSQVTANAHTHRDRSEYELSAGGNLPEERANISGNVTHSHSYQRSERGEYTEGPETAKRHFSQFDAWQIRDAWEKFPTEPALCGRNDGFSSRLDSITYNKNRTNRLKGLGNAVVPSVAYQIFKAIKQFDDQLIFGNEL